ncbi:putative acyl-CoA transferase/carnitine dehydratase [Spongiibacter sp. IMCC21906]|jgi:crotonobetainyl-CoA:carnitine CoA-transferase CaiB-like acyl-CoA transferase|uniref:CaiB/BaiF CoA transferase family protein n=1 Tax=Spongiibacter sp. IMCC21906 TaxID=1620392 RepID=UPI00062DE4E0|nr:CaiB/BaiF CoA-transferase family protein [Spongiibacter sp. IMCC21906]AKH68667.1 putative acyl-CoA transferase/carnitine dehydratase [Spongiibacter sp. IMCC21906]
MFSTGALSNTGALGGIRVLDMTRVVAGPYAGQILGDLGAEVVKIERKGEGDDCRRVGPPWMDSELGRQGQDSTYYQSVNRNKSSISVDFATEAGADLIRQLAANADVLVENYRSGTLARYGLGYEDLKAINPKLIYCSVTGFGQTGPYAGRSGYDYLVQAMAGLMSVTGHHDGVPGDGPMRVGVPIADICAGLYAAISVLAALNYRNVSGEGQYIDVSLFDSQLSAMLNTFSGWFNGGTALGRTGNDHPSAAPYGVFKVDDGYILIATFNDREFVRLAGVLGHAEWGSDPRFCSMGARVANREELKALVTEALKGKTKVEWVEILNAGTVSCGGINEMADIEKDPQVLARELIINQEHPTNGTIRSAASPMRFSASPVTYRQAPPLLGEHNEQVLSSWLGFNDEQISALQEQGAI